MMNPVLAREIRTRVRDWKSPFLVSGYVGALGAVALLYFGTQSSGLLQGHMFGPELGLNVYNLLAFFQLFLISFILPAISAGSISGEKERQTFDLLWVTRLNARSIVLGKLAASVCHMLLVILATAPLYSVIFLFGGLAPASLALTLLVYVATGITFASISIFCSTITRRTTVATVLSYCIVFFLLVGTVVTASLEWSRISRRPPDPANPWRLPPKTIYLNPMVSIASVLPGANFRVPIPGFSSIGRVRPVLVYAPRVTTVPTPGSAIAVSVTPPQPPPEPKLLPPWQYNLMANAVIVLITLGLSILFVDPTGPASKIRMPFARAVPGKR